MEVITQSGVRLIFGPLTVDNVEKSEYHDEKFRAQLRQQVKRVYPAAKTHDSLTSELFSIEEFAFKKSDTEYEEIRVGWIDVPVGTTKEQVEAKLSEHQNARLQRHLALQPILTTEQSVAVQKGLGSTTIESIGAKQVVRDDNGNPVPYKGCLQFRVIKFRTDDVQDADTREKDFMNIEASGVQKPFQMANAVGVLAKMAENDQAKKASSQTA